MLTITLAEDNFKSKCLIAEDNFEDDIVPKKSKVEIDDWTYTRLKRFARDNEADMSSVAGFAIRNLIESSK